MRIWENAAIKSYRLTASLDMHGATPPASPIIIEVNDGKVVSSVPQDPKDTRNIAYYDDRNTVNKLFFSY